MEHSWNCFCTFVETHLLEKMWKYDENLIRMIQREKANERKSKTRWCSSSWVADWNQKLQIWISDLWWNAPWNDEILITSLLNKSWNQSIMKREKAASYLASGGAGYICALPVVLLEVYNLPSSVCYDNLHHCKGHLLLEGTMASRQHWCLLCFIHFIFFHVL